MRYVTILWVTFLLVTLVSSCSWSWGGSKTEDCQDDGTCEDSNLLEETRGGTWHCYGVSKQEPWDCSQARDDTKIVVVDNSLERDNSPERENSLERDNSPERDNSLERENSLERDNSPERDNSLERNNSPERSNSSERNNSPERGDSLERSNSPEPVSATVETAMVETAMVETAMVETIADIALAEDRSNSAQVSDGQAPSPQEAPAPEKTDPLSGYSNTSFVVQLTALPTLDKVTQYAEEFDLDVPMYVKVRSQDSDWYVVLLGVYEAKPKADAAADEWASTHNTSARPWVRPISSLRKAASLAVQ